MNRGGLIEVTAPKRLGPSHKGSNNKLSFHRTFWVNIRINAFVKTWMQTMRRESKGMDNPGAQDEVSLFKSLH